MQRLTYLLPASLAGSLGWATPVAAQTETPAQPLTIDRDGGVASPAVAGETGTWLWLAIAVVAVLVVLGLLKFLLGGKGRTPT